MAKRVQFRRGTSTQHNSFTGALGEVTVDTTLKTLRVHDNVKVGGTILATQDVVNNTAYSVEIIEDLMNVPVEFNTVIVKDINRGGTFVSKTEIDIDPNTGSLYTVNSGTVFAKSGGGFWVRQDSGANNVKWFGAKGDGITDDTAAIEVADAVGLISFPAGTYITTYRPTNPVSGKGATLLINEFEFKLDSTSQSLLSGFNGKYQLLNTVIGINSAKVHNPKISHASVAVGGHALENQVRLYRTTAVGDFACQLSTNVGQFDAFGASAAQASFYGNRCTYIGNNAGKWTGTNDAVASGHDFWLSGGDVYGFGALWPEWRTEWAESSPGVPAFNATSQSDNQYNVGVGRNALLHGSQISSCVAIGYNAHAHAYKNSKCVAVGRGAATRMMKGDGVTAVGASTAYSLMDGYIDTYIGHLTATNLVHSSSNVGIGYATINGESLTDKAYTPRYNVAIGHNAMRNFDLEPSENVAIGRDALQNTTASDNVAIGALALRSAKNATQCVALGKSALRMTQSGGIHYNYNNCVGLGYDSRISAGNQIQLGNSLQTVYAYGAIQDRSDARDKIVKGGITDELISFFMDINWCRYVLDYRDDYIETYDVQTGVDDDGKPIFEQKVRHLEKDGSRARSREHVGAIAQQVEDAMKRHGVDFAGLQHHSISGGEDIYTIGYQEFIAIQGEIIQRQQRQLELIEQRLDKAGL